MNCRAINLYYCCSYIFASILLKTRHYRTDWPEGSDRSMDPIHTGCTCLSVVSVSNQFGTLCRRDKVR